MNNQTPSPLAGETNKAFRLRAVLWIIDGWDSLSYDGILDKFKEIYPKIHVSKESIVRDVKVLAQREVIYSEPDEKDKRNLLWSAYE